MKKWSRGNGTMLTASLRRSQLSWPGKRSEHVVPRAAAHGVDELEALEAVAGLGLLAHDVEDGVDEL